MAFGRGRIAHNVVRDAAVGHLVDALFHVQWSHRGHWLDVLDVHFRKLLDECEDRVELALEVLDLIVRNRDAGEMRDKADGGGVNRHGSAQSQRNGAASISKGSMPLCSKIDNSY